MTISDREQNALNIIGSVDMELINTAEEVDKMLGALHDREDVLNNWEQEFLYDVTVRFTQDGELKNLTVRQRAKIKELYAKHCY